MTWTLTTLAALTSLSGVTGLWASWRLRAPKTALWRRTGWALLGLSLLLWLLAQPAEFAVVFTLSAPAIAAWALIGWRSRGRHPARDTKLEQRGFIWPAPRTLGRHLLTFLMAVPLAGVAAATVTITLMHWLPGEPVNRMVAGVLAAPVVWGAAGYWTLADPRRWRPALVLALAALPAAAYLFL